MGLLAPLGLALFALAVPLVLLYLLKQKREDRVVPSTLLWSKVVHDVQARHPFQKLRASLLLILELLVLALLGVALARPVIRATGERSRAVAIVLDASASMLARDGGGRTRFEAAREEARELARNLRAGDRGMVVLAGWSARVLKTLTADRNEILRALDGARAGETRGELRDAVLLAGAALRPFGAAAEIHIFGDGGGRDLPPAAEAGAAIRFHLLGEDGANVGITGLDVVHDRVGGGRVAFPRRGEGTSGPGLPPPGGRHEPPGRGGDVMGEKRAATSWGVEVFATIENAGEVRERRFVTLYHEDRPMASRALDLAPRTEEAVVFREVLPPGRVALRLDGRDALAADDAAYAVLPPPDPIGVAVVGTSHAALERALEKAGDVELYVGPLEAFADEPKYRLVIYDGVEPGDLPAKTVVVFGARGKLPGVKIGDEVEAPEITGWERDHPLMRFVDLGGVAIARARPLALDGPGRPLIRSDRGLLAVESRARRDPLVAIGIDLRESTWASEEAFPVFVLNVLQMVRKAGGELGPERIAAGEPLSVRAPAPDAAVALVRPSGERVERKAREGRADFLETAEAGFYEVEAGARSAFVAANLLDREETRIAPRPAIDAGGVSVKAEATLAPANREVWRWLALGGLLGLLAEWWVFHRRL